MSRDGSILHSPLTASDRRSRLSLVALGLALVPLLCLLVVAGLQLDVDGDLGEAVVLGSLLCVPAALIVGVVALVRHRVRVLRPGAGLATLAVAISGAEIVAVLQCIQGMGRGLHGRVLRVRGRAVLAPVVAGDLSEGTARPGPALAVEALAPADREALAAHWTLVAREEHASITAFQRLARDLAAHGAPASLVARARVAADQEADHAARCFALAGAFAGGPLAPAPWRAEAGPTPPLARMAVEALIDGCVGEGTGAAEAALLVAGRTTVAPVHATLAVIARDEAGHAELSWAVLAWCLAVGGEPVRAAVELAIAALHDPPIDRADDEPGAALRPHGVPTRGERDAAWRATRDAAAPRARALLRASPARAA